MNLSIEGAMVCIGLLLLGFALRAPLVVPVFASLAFGSTAIVNLSSLGGSSPLIYTMFAAALIASVAARRQFWEDLGRVFARYPTAFVIGGLMVYVAAGAYLLPRLFEGETTALVTRARGVGGKAVVEAPLTPTGGNITQTGYFMLGALMFFSVSILLLRHNYIRQIRLGYIAWASMHAATGIADWLAKTVGAGDVLSPIRTASYAMLTETEHGGFSRVVGAYSEASAFGGVTVACAAFAFADWRVTGSRAMLALSAVLFALVVLSTSSTAYAALTIITAVTALSVLRSALTDKLSTEDVAFTLLLVLGAILVAGTYLFDNRIFDPMITLFEATISNKAASESAIERSYWNSVSLQSALDTDLLGIGLGSSRASSLVVAVVSQLGVIGSALILTLVYVLTRRIDPADRAYASREVVALHDGARAAAICGLITGSIASGSADPGLLFFVALATTLACRYNARAAREAQAPSRGHGAYFDAQPA